MITAMTYNEAEQRADSIHLLRLMLTKAQDAVDAMGTAVNAAETTLDKTRDSIEKSIRYYQDAEEVEAYVLKVKEVVGDDAERQILAAVEIAEQASHSAIVEMLKEGDPEWECQEKADIAVKQGRTAQNLVKDIAGLLYELSDMMDLRDTRNEKEARMYEDNAGNIYIVDLNHRGFDMNGVIVQRCGREDLVSFARDEAGDWMLPAEAFVELSKSDVLQMTPIAGYIPDAGVWVEDIDYIGSAGRTYLDLPGW